jgi:hypothetical protein
VLQIFVQDQGLPFPAALFGLHPNPFFFLLTFALSEFQQFGVRNEHTTTDSPYRKLLACDERVQRSFADSNEPSGFRFAVEQNMPVHIDTSGFSLIEFRRGVQPSEVKVVPPGKIKLANGWQLASVILRQVPDYAGRLCDAELSKLQTNRGGFLRSNGMVGFLREILSHGSFRSLMALRRSSRNSVHSGRHRFIRAHRMNRSANESSVPRRRGASCGAMLRLKYGVVRLAAQQLKISGRPRDHLPKLFHSNGEHIPRAMARETECNPFKFVVNLCPNFLVPSMRVRWRNNRSIFFQKFPRSSKLLNNQPPRTLRDSSLLPMATSRWTRAHQRLTQMKP